MTTRTRLKLIVAKDRAELRRVAAEILARKIQAAVSARGRCTIALSGGSTPGPVYQELGDSDLARKVPWSQLEIYFADERAVPLDDPESNYRLVKETLLRSHPDLLGQVFRMPADAADRDQAAKRYGRKLPDPLDLLVLGMGPDGHTASLFPNSPALDADPGQLVMLTEDPSGLNPHKRMTLTYAGVARARLVIFTVAGEAKRRCMQAVVDGADLPAARVKAERILWLVDRAAAPEGY